MQILLVEDDPSLATILQVCLEQAGHHVLGPAATCSQAEELINGRDTGDVIALIDVHLADGRLGTDLAKTLRDKWHIPCLFTTGETNKAYRSAGAGVGVLAKPYEVSSLLAALDAIICRMAGYEPFHIPAGLVLFDGFPSPHAQAGKAVEQYS